MKKYFEHRCRTIERCMPESPFRDQVTQLHDEMLEQIACQCLDYCEKADPYSKTPDGYCRESSPQHPLQKLGARLAEILDEDHWAECEALLLAAGVTPNA